MNEILNGPAAGMVWGLVAILILLVEIPIVIGITNLWNRRMKHRTH